MNLTQLPNIITSIRLILLIPLSFYLSNDEYLLSLIIFLVAGFSDALDGYLAKKFNWVSRFGSILDPIADKALLVITMGILTINQIVSWPLFLCVTLRDIYIISGACFYYKSIGPFDMKPSLISKVNTFAQLLMVTSILVSLGFHPMPKYSIEGLIILVYITVILSTVHYSYVWGKKYKRARQSLNNKTAN